MSLVIVQESPFVRIQHSYEIDRTIPSEVFFNEMDALGEVGKKSLR